MNENPTSANEQFELGEYYDDKATRSLLDLG